MKLYEINEEIERLANGLEIDEETGEIINYDDIKSQLDKLDLEKERKVDSISWVIETKLAMIEARKEKIKSLQKMNKTDENTVERLKEYLSYALESWDMDKMETAEHKISFRKSVSVNVYNEELVPAEFIKEKIERSVDKTAIKNYIKESGNEVNGVILVDNKNIQIK